MRLIPLIGLLSLAAACSSPTAPESLAARFKMAPSAVIRTIDKPGVYTVSLGDTVILTLPPELGPWHGQWDDAILTRTAFSNASWTFQAAALTPGTFQQGGFTLIALTDDPTWRSAADTPLRRYYLITVELP